MATINNVVMTYMKGTDQVVRMVTPQDVKPLMGTIQKGQSGTVVYVLMNEKGYMLTPDGNGGYRRDQLKSHDPWRCWMSGYLSAMGTMGLV